MAYDFWNNPLVVSSFRVKHRRGSLYLTLMLYVSFLSLACVTAWYLLPYLRIKAGVTPTDAEKLHWIFGGLLVLQTVLSSFLCMVMTSSAMTIEVNDGTLEYQRLTKLSPVQLLVGKLFGAPATIYMMTFASVPFTFGIWALNPDVSLDTLLLLYANMAASTLAGGAMGLINPLRKKEQGQVSQAGVGIAVSLGGVWAIMLQFAIMGGMTGMLSGRGPAALTSLLLPLGPIVGFFQHHDPWYYGLNFFGARIPYLLATPLAQLAAAALCFVHMRRRLISTVNPVLSKPWAYLFLATTDLLVAAVLYDPLPTDATIWFQSTRFWLCHLIVAAMLILCVAPDRDLLLSWIWRWRGRCPLWRDLWLRDRSENILVLATFCLIGLCVWGLAIAVPVIVANGWDAAQPYDTVVINVVALACLLTMSIGTQYQSGLIILGKAGPSILATLAFLDVFALVAPNYLDAPWLTSFSLVGHWLSWRQDETPLPLWPIAIFYGGLLVPAWMLLRRGVRREMEEVQRKWAAMGIE